MAANAAWKVFATVELLENILLQLDLEADTVCLCKLVFVNRNSSHTILGSPRLRECLCIAMPMSPYGLGPQIYSRIQQNALLLNRPSLFELFNLWPGCQINESLDHLRTRSRTMKDYFQGLLNARAEWWWETRVFHNAPCPIMMGLNDRDSALLRGF